MSRNSTPFFALIRHGDYHQLPDTPSAHQPFPLTPQGREQALACADHIANLLENNSWQISPVIDTSQLLRAWETATILLQRLQSLGLGPFQVEAFDALAERGLGVAGNLSIGQIADVISADPRAGVLPDDWKSNSHFRLPVAGAESLIDAGRRVAAHIEQRLDGEQGERTHLKLFVGHGAAFRHAAYHKGALRFDELAQLSMHHADPIVFAVEGPQWRLVSGRWKVRSETAKPD